MSTITNETLSRLAEAVGLEDLEPSAGLDLLAAKDHRYLKDLKVNVSNALLYPNLSRKESFLVALAVAANEKNNQLVASFSNLAANEGATDDELAEVHACVSLMNVNNVFYRFRHFVGKEYYAQTPAGIKMNIMINPVLGKEFFELLSLAVSAVNGCEKCVNAHEQSVLSLGCTEARVYDAVRLAAVIKGLVVLA
jgi:lipoyl-dependent peroxiredoxin subunit D